MHEHSREDSKESAMVLLFDLRKNRVGEVIRVVRNVQSLRIVDLARLASVHPNTVARIERGEVSPTMDVTNMIFKALNIEHQAFYRGNGSSDSA